MKDKEYVLTSQRMTPQDRDKFQKISEHTGVSMTSQLKIWIREHYNKLPKEAK